MNPTKRIYLAIREPHLRYVLMQVFSEPDDRPFTISTRYESADVVLSDHMVSSEKPIGILSIVPHQSMSAEGIWFGRPYSLESIFNLLTELQ